jgi:NADH:ubiquinone oxidoreductase subunit 6 (subunit J)
MKLFKNIVIGITYLTWTLLNVSAIGLLGGFIMQNPMGFLGTFFMGTMLIVCYLLLSFLLFLLISSLFYEKKTEKFMDEFWKNE